MLITADHGNIEQMLNDETGEPHTAHTLSPVPLVLVNPPPNIVELKNGVLADIAPTLISILGLNPPSEMTGSSLILENNITPPAVANGTH
jgi:2,3-bisphosphoglycerate-independent phosphoglycerate mutase